MCQLTRMRSAASERAPDDARIAAQPEQLTTRALNRPIRARPSRNAGESSQSAT